MADTFAIRKTADLEKLKALQKKMPNTLEITSVRGSPPASLSCRITIPTAKDTNYPGTRQDVSVVEIQLPERYPFQPPLVTFTTPIWNPNVYPSGKWCFGQWKVTENLEMFIVRLMKVIALDPTIINPSSPANGPAASWYVDRQARQPGSFPTVKVLELMTESEQPKIAWRNVK